MPFIDEMPAEQGSGTCEKHGDFNYRYANAFAGKILVSEFCPKCEEDRKEEERRLEDEKNEQTRRNRIISNKKTAGISIRNLYADFEIFTTDNQKQEVIKKKAIAWFDKFIDHDIETPSMIITGKVGTGKTLLASCIVNKAITLDAEKEPLNIFPRCGSYRIIKLIDLVRSLKDTWRRDSESTEKQLIERLSNYDLLIIDEVGMGFDSDTEKMFIFDVIDGRYQNMLPTVLISNLNTEGIKNSIGERALDRLRDGGGVLLGCDWESFRK